MSLIQKVESGYLQFLRVVFLLFATFAIIAALVLGAQFLAGQNAQPVLVDQKIQLKAESYKVLVVAEEKGESKASPLDDAPAKDKLLADFLSVIETNAKRLSPEFHLNKTGAANVFAEMEKDSNLGREFLTQVVPTLDASLKNPGFKPKDPGEFIDGISKRVEFFKSDYKNQVSSLRSRKIDAEADAVSTRASAQKALYTAGIGFGAFVLLILLVVLLKIERNLRGGAMFQAKEIIIPPEALASPSV